VTRDPTRGWWLVAVVAALFLGVAFLVNLDL